MLLINDILCSVCCLPIRDCTCHLVCPRCDKLVNTECSCSLPHPSELGDTPGDHQEPTSS